jgi:hypothetical protein
LLFSIAVIAAPFMFHNGGCSWEWLKVGIVYGTEHFQAMTMGHPSNLPAILQGEFGIGGPEQVAFVWPAKLNLLGTGECAIRWRMLLRCVFAVFAIFCGVAMGVHYRRRSPLFLVALTALWLAFVTFPAQIHERYVLYPAIVSATLLAVGVSGIFMHTAIMLMAILPVLGSMLMTGNSGAWMAERMGAGFGTQLRAAVESTHPGIGWAWITLTLVCLYKAMPRGSGAKRDEAVLEAQCPKIERGTGR